MGRKVTQDDAIKRLKEVWGDKYDFSCFEYAKAKSKTYAICKKHGKFPCTYDNLMHKHGCPECGGNKKHTTEEYIRLCEEKHQGKYDYSKTIYRGNKSDIIFTCPIHGDHTMKALKHLSGQGCPKCGQIRTIEAHKDTQEDVIGKFENMYGDEYDYQEFRYVDSTTPSKIICKTHGAFWKSSNKHLQGQGCPICRSSQLEFEVRKILEENKIEYKYEKQFEWLGLQSIDFYLPEYNIGIECQGVQHFKPIELWGGESKLNYIKSLDKRKAALCQENKLQILYYTSTNLESYPYKVITNKEELLNKILRCKSHQK